MGGVARRRPGFQNRPVPTVEPLGQLVPGPAAAGVDVLRANNNLDLCWFEGRLYLAWRTAPSHFASPRARLEVSSAADPAGPWRHETTVAFGADVREPRLVADGATLQLFCMELGGDPKRFQPRRVHRVTRAAGAWARGVVAIDEPIVPWRFRHLDGRWVLSSYRGAEQMYGPAPAAPTVELRFSDDLLAFSEPLALHRGGTECELVRLPDGRWLGVTRNEGPGRFGSDLLVGPSLGELRVHPRPEKLDSPNLFLWDGRPWLLARRSPGRAGRYDVAPHWLPGSLGIRVNQALWSLGRKRSALWQLDPDGPGLRWALDLPSRGDTAFAAQVAGPDGSLLLADYTSPESAGDPRWVRGQFGPTVIQLLALRPGD